MKNSYKMTPRNAEVSKLPPADPTLLNRLAWSSRWSDRARSTSNAEKALRDAESGQGVRTDAQRGLALRTLSWQARWRGDFDEGLRLGLKAEELLSEKKFPVERATIYANLATIHANRGRLDLAQSAMDRALLLIEDDEPRGELVEALTIKATLQSFTGDRTRAGLTLGRARELANGAHVALVERTVAKWLIDGGEQDRASKHVIDALEAADLHDNRLILAYCHELAGICRRHEGAAPEAERHFTAGLELAEVAGDRAAKAHLLFGLGSLDLDRERFDDAEPRLREAASLCGSMGYSVLQMQVALVMAELYESKGALERALEQHKIAWKFRNAIRV